MPLKAQQSRRLTKENIEYGENNQRRKSIIPNDEGLGSGLIPMTTHAQMRRPSRWDPRLLAMDRRYSIASRASISGASGSKQGPQIKYENTYKAEPDIKFESHKAKNIMAQTLNEWLSGVEYSPSIRKLTTGLTDEIKKRVKALGFARYKFVVTVTICQDAKQSMQMVSRCMWNKDTDNFAEAVYKTADVHAIATLYACYFE